MHEVGKDTVTIYSPILGGVSSARGKQSVTPKMCIVSKEVLDMWGLEGPYEQHKAPAMSLMCHRGEGVFNHPKFSNKEKNTCGRDACAAHPKTIMVKNGQFPRWGFRQQYLEIQNNKKMYNQ